MKKIFAAAVAFGLILSVLSMAHAASYAFKALPSGYSPRGINNAGTVVGMYKDMVSSPDKSRAFVVTNGVTETFALGDEIYTAATGVNNAGTVVGSFGDKDGRHGFTMAGGVSTVIKCSGNPNLTYATGINNAGTVAGVYYSGENLVQHAFLWSGGTCTNIDYPGSSTSTVFGINDAGTVVGSYGDSTNPGTGFVRLSNGTYQQIVYPGSSAEFHPFGINNEGTVVGYYWDDTNARGFTWRDGKFIDSFDYPPNGTDGYQTFATGINDQGLIVGGYVVDTHHDEAYKIGFVATPSVTLTGTIIAEYCGATSCARVPYPGVTIDITSTDTSQQVTTGEDGTYTVSVSPDVTYTLTPSVSDGTEFNPDSLTVHPTESMDKLDFLACVDHLPTGAAYPAPDAMSPKTGGECALGVDWEMDRKLKRGKTFDDNTYYDTGLLRHDIIYPPDGWKVNLFLTRGGAKIGTCASDPLVQWRWEVTPKAKVITMPGTGCSPFMIVKEPGTYKVTAKRYTSTGDGSFTFPKNGIKVPKQPKSVEARNYIIVGLGDSNGSGEGNPWAYTGAVVPWTFDRCHRSQTSYQFKAALYVQDQNPRASVTFLWPSCSGARIEHLHKQAYQGIVPDAGGGSLYPQISQVAELLRVKELPWEPKKPRSVDAVIISAGVNNLYFGSIMEFCMKKGFAGTACEGVKVSLVPKTSATAGPGDRMWVADSSSATTLNQAVRGLLKNLDGKYEELAGKLSSPVTNDGTGGLGVAPQHVVISQYPDFSHDEEGQICDTSWLHSVWGVAKWGLSTWTWLKDRTVDLNSRVLATRKLGWKVATLGGSDFQQHGYCAGSYKSGILTNLPPWGRLGNLPSFGRSYFLGVATGAAEFDLAGGFHPIAQGHNVTSYAVDPLICNALYGNGTCEGTPK